MSVWPLTFIRNDFQKHRYRHLLFRTCATSRVTSLNLSLTLSLKHGYVLQVPERVLKTVRVSITTKEVEEDVRVKIGILIVGNQDNFEHIRCVKTRNYIFSPQDQIINFDDIVDYEELMTLKPKSQFLSGEFGESFKILVTITPLSKFSSLELS